MKTAIGSIVVFVLLIVLAGLLYMYSGAYNVSAKAPENPVVSWVLNSTRERSVENRASDITAPGNITDEQVIHAGAERYREDCAACHGSPGNYPGEIGAGLNPRPPKLWAGPSKMEPGELYWVIMHGVRMTGMPAWDHAYSPDQAWSVVAFVKALPKLSAEQYRELTGAARPNEEASKRRRSVQETPETENRG